MVEGCKEGYLLLSLPHHAHILAYAASTDFNVAHQGNVKRRFTPGLKLAATLQVGRGAAGGRLGARAGGWGGGLGGRCLYVTL